MLALSGDSVSFFAARAWEGHQHYGRGALVVLMWEVKEVKDSPGFYAISPKYAYEGSELLKKIGFWPHSGMEQILKEYDPEREVIIIFIRLNREAVSYSWRTPEDLTAPKAYKEWQERHPIGIRLDRNRSLEECLRPLIEYELRQKEQRKAAKEKILSDSALQAGYLQTLIDDQIKLKAELEAWGIGIGADGVAYEIQRPASPARNSFERLLYFGKIVEYLAITTAVNQVLRVYESSMTTGEEWLKEAVRVGLETYDDKLTVGMASYLLFDFDWAEDTEEMQKIFLIMTAARLRANLKRYPRIQAVLAAEAKAEGKSTDDVLLSRLLSNTVLALFAYEKQPHDPFVNDSGTIVKEIARLITNDSQPVREQNYLSDLQNDLDKFADSDSTDFARQLESSDELAAWFQRAGLAPAEQEIAEFKAQGYTYPEIAEETGRSVGTVKPLASRALQKLKRSR